ncbi:MAG TPA: hypothetical protein VFY40_08525 [Blastocatellia bacterium]|nr:hypothetical protein [Blastocatellia bacterium]
MDRRALKALFDAYWTSAGWRDEGARAISPDDFEYGKRVGVMFDDIRLSHADIVSRAISAVRGVDRRAVANAFVASLSSRRLELRSALGSFAVLQHFPRHTVPRQSGSCPVCGVYNREADLEDLNILNFERFKWGGVRHDDPLYASLDLQLFQKLPHINPTAGDVAIFKNLLQTIEAAPVKTTSATLEKHLAKVFKSNKAERDTVVGILGLCGLLGVPAHPGYLGKFIPCSKRELPGRHFVDMVYPACWWKRSDGINHEALVYWFGHLL